MNVLESESHVMVEANTDSRRIPVIGIVGGIGSGKSAVAKWVAQQANVEVLDADWLGHESLQDSMVKRALIERFGTSVLQPTGEIDRSVIANLVFGSDDQHIEARRALEQIVHPEIAHRISQRIAAAAAQGKAAVLLDAAVLFEAGWRTNCDAVVFIDTPDKVRISRVLQSRHWTEDELRRRESSQWSLTDKRRESDLIITNSGQVKDAGQQLLDLLRQQGLINFSTEQRDLSEADAGGE